MTATQKRIRTHVFECSRWCVFSDIESASRTRGSCAMYGEPIVQTRVAECMLASRATNPGSRRNGCKAYPAVDVAVSFPIQVVVYSSFREVALLINMLVVTHTHKITTHTHKITKKEILSFLTFFFWIFAYSINGDRIYLHPCRRRAPAPNIRDHQMYKICVQKGSVGPGWIAGI